MKKSLISALFVSLLCSAAYSGVPYKVIVPMHEEAPGTMVYLSNYDTGQLVDSAAVADEHVTFTGDIDEALIARLSTANGRICNFIVEEGTVTINREKRRAVGMMLNDELNNLTDELSAIEEEYDAATNQEEAVAALGKYMEKAKQAASDNADSPIGYVMFMEWSSLARPQEVMEFLDNNTSLKDYARVAKLTEGLQNKIATSEGKPFVDFEVEYNGTTQRLSDYVGKGKYTLVDFWASWCGPCIQEIKVIKEIYNEYSDKGLDVLGVAVWDKPSDTEAAIKRLSLPWPVIVNSQNIATDLYGIPAIPCIILFGPDGTIVSRDARGAELKAIVAKALAD